jgi:hypothetical protein
MPGRQTMQTLMVRGFMAAAALLAIGAVGLAADDAKKAKHPVHGVLKNVDAAAGTFTVTVKKKKETKDLDFTIDDSVKVVIFVGQDKKELTGKEGLKNEAVKVGVNVQVVRNADDKVTEVQVGAPPHNATAKGKVKKVDASAGVLTVTVKKKKQETDADFKVEDATKVLIFAGDQKKELAGKDGLKSDEFKEGAAVAVVTDPNGKVLEVRLGTPPKK